MRRVGGSYASLERRRELGEVTTDEHESALEEAASRRWMIAALVVGAGGGFGSQFGVRMPGWTLFL
jgi:hypothetical protein